MKGPICAHHVLGWRIVEVHQSGAALCQEREGARVTKNLSAVWERAALVPLRNLREVTWLRLGWEGRPRGAVAGASRPRGHGSPGGQTHSTDVEMSKRVFIGIGSCDFWRPKSPKTDHLLAGAPGTMVERPSQGEDH